MNATLDTRAHPLLQAIAHHNIKRIAMVDDAFDEITIDSFEEGEDAEFISVINDNDTLLQEFHRIVSGEAKADIINRDNLTKEALDTLWGLRNGRSNLGDVVLKTIFRVIAEKASDVETLRDVLKTQLGLDVEKFGTESAIPSEPFDIAFIDYMFGSAINSKESIERSVNWARKLYENGQTLIILMSGHGEAIIKQDQFRADSGLTRGLFEFITKTEVADAEKLCNRLNTICAGYRTRHDIHEFVVATEVAAENATNVLKESIRGLGLEDYAYLEKISLEKDGHPLGEYAVWLFGEYLVHLLSDAKELQAPRKKVNELKFDQLLPFQRPPTSMLAKMYSDAITEPVYEGWGPHSRYAHATIDTGRTDSANVSAAITALVEPDHAPEASTSPPATELPLFQLGDLFIKDKDSPVYMVLNAGCDLQFSPGEKKRECDLDQSILLIPGKFEPLHERAEESNEKRTELYELDGQRFRITWQHTRAITIPNRNVREKYEVAGYKRTSRLKLPYALEIQQHFAAQLTRVGVPTPTPVFVERSLRLYCKAQNGQFSHLATVEKGLLIFHHRHKEQFVMTVDCVHSIMDCLKTHASTVEQELKAVAETPRTDSGGAKTAKRRVQREKDFNNLQKVRSALAQHCIFQNELHKLPPVGGRAAQYDDKAMQIEIRHVDGLSGQYDSSAPIVLTFSLTDPASSSDNSERRTEP